jgi:hypothetical protein
LHILDKQIIILNINNKWNREENMKNKKILILFIISVILIVVIGYFAIKYVKQKKNNEIQNEYVPQEEISDEQSRETIVSLYFTDKETNMLKPEARLVNVKELIQSPYNVLIELLIQGPKNDKLKSVIPENTKLLNSSLDGECLTLDFSSELLNYNKENDKEKENLINSIVNTVTELNEVNKVKFLVNGQACNDFEEFYIRKS